MDIADEELFAIIMEEADESYEPMPPIESWDGPLLALFEDVQAQVKLVADKMKNGESLDREADAERYIRLNHIFLGLQHWSDDIKVKDESPLGAIESDTTGFEVLASRLRTCFQEMLAILLNDELLTESVASSMPKFLLMYLYSTVKSKFAN